MDYLADWVTGLLKQLLPVLKKEDVSPAESEVHNTLFPIGNAYLSRLLMLFPPIHNPYYYYF
ncbi:MAG: hypothetical protein IJJ25_09505 [Lachnospiraceae bacterium]|nr:hypothetical protein [Lachnospiraceae bacterium]